MKIETILEERGSRYGTFETHAKIAQAFQYTFWSVPSSWLSLDADIRQSLVVISDKIARVLNADAKEFYDDNWIDILGYSTLVAHKPSIKGQALPDYFRRFIENNLPLEKFDNFIQNAINEILDGIMDVIEGNQDGWKQIMQAARDVLNNEHFLLGQRLR